VRLPNKSAVRDALLGALSKTLAAVVSAAHSAHEGAVHEEARAEGDKDMRSTEQSYLARGQAMRAEELAEQLQRFELAPLRAYEPHDPIGPGALVAVRVDDEERFFFVLAQGGGTELEVEGVRVTVVTPSSPVGAALTGRRVGDEYELAVRGVMREWSVEAIA
jgi:transcription elongation GreA/GreB family factor